MYNNIKPIVPGFGTSQVRPEYSPSIFKGFLEDVGFQVSPGLTCQTHQRWSAGFPGPCCEDDTSGRHVHTHGEGFRGQQDLPASPVQNVSETGQKGKEKPWKNTTAEGVMRIHLETNWNWSSTGAQLAELTQALGRTWSQLPGEAEKGQCGWSDALKKKKNSTGVPGYPRKDATCQGRPTVLSRYHHTSFNNPAILYHEALRK